MDTFILLMRVLSSFLKRGPAFARIRSDTRLRSFSDSFVEFTMASALSCVTSPFLETEITCEMWVRGGVTSVFSCVTGDSCDITNLITIILVNSDFH